MTPPPMVADHQVTEDTPVDLFEGSMDLLVVLPNDKCLPMSFERRLPLMDLLIHIANTHKFSPGGHVLEIIDNEGSTLPCKPSTRLGMLNAHTVYVVAKNKINERLKSSLSAKSPKSTPEATGSAQQQPFENTFRLQIRLPRNQLYVIRATWRTLLSEILQRVCADKGLDALKYELRHPVQSDERLDLSRTPADYQLQEVSVVPVGQKTNLTVSLTDLSAMKKATASRAKSPATSEAAANGTDKKRRGLFGFVFGKKTKPGMGESISSSDIALDRSLSPSRSEEPPPAAVPTPEPVAASPASPPSPVLVSKRLAEEAVAKRNSRLIMLATTSNEPLSPSQDKQSQQPTQQPKPPARQKKKAAPPPPPAPATQPDALPVSNGTPKRPDSVISSSSTSSDSTAVSSPASVVIRSAAASDIGSDISSRPSSRRSIEPPLPVKGPVGVKDSPARSSSVTPKKAAAPMMRTSLTNLNQVKSTSELSLVSSAKKRKAPPPPLAPTVQPEAPPKTPPPAQKTSPPAPVVAPHVAPKPSPRKKSARKFSSSSIDSDDLELEDMDMFTTKTELETLGKKPVISSDEELEECVVVHQSETIARRSSSDVEEIALNMLQIPRRSSRVSNSSRSEFFSISSRSSPENSGTDSELEIQEMQLSFLLQRQKKKDAIPADLSMIPVEELQQGLDSSSATDTKDFRRSISETTFTAEDNNLAVMSTSPTRSQSYNISSAVDNNFAIFGSISSPFEDGRWNGDSTLTLDHSHSSVVFDIKGWSSHSGLDSDRSSTCSSGSSSKKRGSESDPSYATVSFSSSSKDGNTKPVLSVPSVEPVYAMVVKKNKPVPAETNEIKADDETKQLTVVPPPELENKLVVQDTSSSSGVESEPSNIEHAPVQSSPVVPPEPLPRSRKVSSSSSSSESESEVALEDLGVAASPIVWNDEVPAPPPPMFQDDLESKIKVKVQSNSESDSEAQIPVPEVSTKVPGSTEAKLTLSFGTELEQETATDDLDGQPIAALVLNQDSERFGEESTTDDVVCPPPDFGTEEQHSSSSSESEPEFLEKDSLNEDSHSDPDAVDEVKTAPPSLVPETKSSSTPPPTESSAPSVLALLSQAQNLLSSTADPNAKVLQEEFIRLQQQFFAWQQLQQQPKKKTADTSSDEIHSSSSSSESRKKSRRVRRKAKAAAVAAAHVSSDEDEEEKADERRRQTLEEFKRKRREEKERQEKLKEEEEERKRKELEKRRRMEEEREERRRKEKEEEERKRMAEERVRREQKEEEEERRRKMVEEEKRRLEEERRKKEKEEEEERRRKLEEEEKQRLEEKLRKQLEEEIRIKIQKEEEERRRKKEEEEKQRIEEQLQKKREEEDRIKKEKEDEEKKKKEKEEEDEREKQKKREEAQDRMRQLLDQEEVVLAQRERELLQQKRRVEKSSSKCDSSSSSSSDSSSETETSNIKPAPVYRYRGPPQVTLEPWKPGRPKSAVIDLSSELTFDIPEPLLPHHKDDSATVETTSATSRDSPDSGIEGYDSLPAMPVTPPHKPKPPAKTFNLSRKPSVDTPQPFKPTAQQLFKRSTFVPVVKPVPFVQRKINKAPEVRGFSSLTTTETTEPSSLPTTGAGTETKPRLLSIVQQEVNCNQEGKLQVLRKLEIRQKAAGVFERPQLRPVSMPVAPSGSGHLAHVDTPTSSTLMTETKRRISPAKFTRVSDPRDDLLKSIRDFSSGTGLKKTGVTLH